MIKYLVIGNPIEHSLSPLIHNYWIKKYVLAESIYEKKKVEKKDLEKIVEQVRNGELKGVNVTVPFKKDIIPFLDGLDDVAKKTLSVNTLCKVKEEVWGYNTDAKGFDDSLKKEGINYRDKNIFIIGSGGVTSSILYHLTLYAKKVYVTNRTKEKAHLLKTKDTTGKIEVVDWGQVPNNCNLIINTTSIGLNKDERINLNFKDYEKNKDVLFYDLIYNPIETNFLMNARLRGNKTMNGKMMFLNQAQTAFQIWTKIVVEIDDKLIDLLDND